MAVDRVQRRMAAILAADVVGYSRLMGADEAPRSPRSRRIATSWSTRKIAEHRGRIVKLTGDGMLVEFPSVVNAVACAADIQRKMRERNVDVPEERRIEFRVGVNLGDVIVEGDDIFGDGVNVAARLEGIAPPGGIAISGDGARPRRQPARPRLRGHGRAGAEEHRRGRSASTASRLASPSAVAASSAHAAPSPAAEGEAVDRGPALRQHERRPGAGIFRRRHHRGHHHRPVEGLGALRHRAELGLHLQGHSTPTSRR